MRERYNSKVQVFRKALIAAGGILLGGLMIARAVSFVNKQDEARRVHEIASHFKCICPMKCDLAVASCSCKEKNGALEKKAFIRDLLKDGKSNSEIMVLFNQKYGGLIG